MRISLGGGARAAGSLLVAEKESLQSTIEALQKSRKELRGRELNPVVAGESHTVLQISDPTHPL